VLIDQEIGHFAAIGGNGLAFKDGDDKDESPTILG
jgi:hypothetical protein